MRAYQAYVSVVMRKFNFPARCNLQSYYDKTAPLVVYGLYRAEDLAVVEKHKGIVYLFWCGDDVLRAPLYKLEKDNIKHLVTLPAIGKYLSKFNIKPIKVKFPAHQGVSVDGKYNTLGNSIYSYLRKGKPKYHGSDLVYKLDVPQDIIIGDQSIGRTQWHKGKCERFYSKAFIGLFLSSFAGGGHGIVEMGLRGIKVITNVLDLPHCLHWESIDDIQELIREESKQIGCKRDIDLANKVYDSLAHSNDCFDLQKEII